MDTAINVDLSDTAETSDYVFETSQRRYMLTQVGQQSLVFPSHWVSEIMLIERSQILNLPFYDRALLGLAHYNSNIVPLLSAQLLLTETSGHDVRSKTLKETLTTIRLSVAVDGLTGVGIVVDHVVGSFTHERVTNQRFFQRSDVPSHLWQPHW
ncbi:MAG: hypothetical protein ACAF41_03370 [Leptolyngbya sp. BL-A-14]